MNRTLRWYDYITINIYFLGLATLSQTMSPLVIPLLVQQFVGEAQKATFYGTARLWTLMTALLVQALMGILSDRSTSRSRANQQPYQMPLQPQVSQESRLERCPAVCTVCDDCDAGSSLGRRGDGASRQTALRPNLDQPQVRR